MSACYRIRNWGEHFETHESRKLKGLKWVAIPNKHDGLGYRRMMKQENGAAMYGAWVLLAAVASKCPERGTLSDDNGALSLQDIADKTDCPLELLAKTVKFCTENLKWIEQVEHESAALPADDAVAPAISPATCSIPDRTGHNRTRQNPDPVSGAFSKPTPAKAEGKSIFRKITTEDLRDDAVLLSWFEAALKRDKPVVRDSEADLLNVFAAAEHALGRGEKPPALFATVVGKRKWDVISQAEEDRARKRLKGVSRNARTE